MSFKLISFIDPNFPNKSVENTVLFRITIEGQNTCYPLKLPLYLIYQMACKVTKVIIFLVMKSS